MADKKREQIGVTVPPGSKLRLEALARQFELLRGSHVSLSALLTAIADGSLHVGPPFQFDEAHSRSLAKAAAFLSSQGDYAEARLLCALLRERGTLSADEWRSVRSLRLTAPEEWYAPLHQHILSRQPFEVRGRDLAGVDRTWTVRHASLSRFNQHGYLDVWAEEVTGNPTAIEELAHQWVIPVATIESVLPASGPWRDDFDRIEAVVKVASRLNMSVENLPPEDVQERLLLVHSPLHAAREILGWGLPCEVVRPSSLREYVEAHRQQRLPVAASATTPTRGVLALHQDRQTVRQWLESAPSSGVADRARPLVRIFEKDAPLSVRAACTSLRPASVPPVRGAGVPLTASTLQSVERRWSLDDDVSAVITLQWVQSMTITYRVQRAPGSSLLILVFESADGTAPLSAVGLPSSSKGQSVSLPAKELGFDPSSTPWRVWPLLA